MHFFGLLDNYAFRPCYFPLRTLEDFRVRFRYLDPSIALAQFLNLRVSRDIAAWALQIQNSTKDFGNFADHFPCCSLGKEQGLAEFNWEVEGGRSISDCDLGPSDGFRPVSCRVFSFLVLDPEHTCLQCRSQLQPQSAPTWDVMTWE